MVTIYDWFGYPVPTKDRYRMIREAGFDGILMWWSNSFGRDCFGADEYRKGPEMAREADLIVENIHTPIETENDLWLDTLAGESVADCYLQCVQDCAAFEIPTMVVHLPSERHPHTPLGLSRVKRIAEKAEQLGVNVALENLKNLPNLADMLEQVDSPRVGFCYDACHHYTWYPGEDLLSRYGARLMALHLHDNNGEHAQHGLPFDGTMEWEKVICEIERTGYSGPTAIEAMNWAYLDLTIEAYLKKAFERASRLEKLRGSMK